MSGKGFNLSANLVLSGPSNIKPIVAQIRRQIGSINANVQLKFDPKANKNANILAQNVGKLSTSLNALTSSATSSASAINDLSKAFSNFQRINSSTISTLNSTGKAVNKISKASDHAAGSFNKFGKEAALAVKRFAAYTIVTAGVFGFVNAIGKAVGEAIEFQHELVKISQVTGKSTKELSGLVGEVSRLSTNLGVSSKQLINVAQILAQAGLSADDTKISLEALAKSSLAPTFKDIENTTEGAIAAMAQFKIKAKDLESVLGSVNSVSAAFAVESEDLISVIRRAGGAFAAAGAGIGNFGSESERGVRQLQELSALFTSVRATTRESADSIATGLRTIFTRVQRGSTIEFLKQFNIQLAEGGKFVGQFEAFKRLSEGLKDLDTRDIRFSGIIEELGGFRQVSKVIPLLKNFAVAEEALGVAIGGQTSLTKDAATAQESIQVQIAKTREKFLELIRDISQTGTFKAITQGVLSLANGFITLATYLKPVIPLITTLFAIKGFQALRQFTSGFTGAFRGVTANQLGQNAGGAVAGTGGGTAAAATATLATSQSLLKNAILANTYAINSLTNIIGSSRLGGGRSPKFGPGFARGGVVPGSGNTDSVPAMLMPGEFVIRKKAVEALGTERLHAANKFGKGGPQKKKKRKTLFQPGLSKSPDALTFGSIFIDDGTNDNNYTPFKAEQNIKIPGSALGKGRKAINANLISSSLSKQAYNNVVNTIDAPIRQLISDVALDISGGLSDIGSIGTIPNLNAIQGSIFEGAVASLGAPIGNIGDDQRTFDYPGGLKSASYLFDSRLTDAPTDAKRTYNRDALRSIRSKIIRSLSDTGKPKAEAAKALSTSELDLLRATNKELSPADIGRILNRKVSGAELKPFFVRRGKFKFASGGSVGTDSVPAMLTPGEFVLRKEAAQRIGSSNLNDLNNADKVQRFAKGGGVMRNGVLHFAKGSGVKKAKRIFDDEIISEGTQDINTATKSRRDALEIAVRDKTKALGLSIEESDKAVKNLTKVWVQITKDGKKLIDIEKTVSLALSGNKRASPINNRIPTSSIPTPNQFGSGLGTGTLNKPNKPLPVGTFVRNLPKAQPPLDISIDRGNSSISRNKGGASKFSSLISKLALVSEEEKKNASPIDIANLRANRLQNVIGGAGALAATASQFVPRDTKGGAVAGGLLSGAGNGAAIGAVAGPYGAAAGALIGATLGAAQAFDNFNKEDALNKFVKSTALASAALEKLTVNANDQQAQKDFIKNSNKAAKGAFDKFAVDNNTIGKNFSASIGGGIGIVPGLNQAFGGIARQAGFNDEQVRTVEGASGSFRGIGRFLEGQLGGDLKAFDKNTSNFDELAKTDGFFSALATSIGEGFDSKTTVESRLKDVNTAKVDVQSQELAQVAKDIKAAIALGSLKKKDLTDNQKLALASQNEKVKERAVKLGGFEKVRGASKKEKDFFDKEAQKEVDKEFKRKSDIDASSKALKDFTSALDNSVKNLRRFSDDLRVSIEDINASGDATFNGLEGIQSGNFSFANSRDFDKNSRAISRVDTLTANELEDIRSSSNIKFNPEANKAFDGLKEVKTLDDKLRDIVGGLDLQKLDAGDIRTQIETALGGEASNPVVQKLLDSLSSDLVSRQGEFGGEPAKVQDFFDKEFSSRLDTLGKQFAETTQAFIKQEEANNRTKAVLADRRGGARRTQLESELQLGDIRTGGALAIAEATGGLPPSAATRNAGFTGQLQTLTGVAPGQKQIDIILADFAKSTAEMTKLQEEEKQATEEQIEKHARLSAATKKIATDMTQFNTAIKKASEAAAKRDAIGNFAQKALQAGPEELNNLAVGFGVGNQIQAGNLGAVNGGNIQQFQAALPDILETIREFQGKDAADEFKIKATEAQFRADGKLDPVEKATLDAIKARDAERKNEEAIAAKAIQNQIDAATKQFDASTLFANAVDKLTKGQEQKLDNALLPNRPRNNGAQNFPRPGTFDGDAFLEENGRALPRTPSGPPQNFPNPAAPASDEFRITPIDELTRNNKKKINGGLSLSGEGITGGFNSEQFTAGLAKFGESINQFASIKIPEKITVEVAPIQTVVSFAGEGVLANAVAKEVSNQLGIMVQQQLAGLINPLNGQVKDGIA